MIDDHPSTILGVKTAVNQTNDMEFYNGYATLPEFYENVYGPSRKAVIYPVDVVLLDLRLADSSNPYDNTIALIKLGFKVLIYSSLESPFRFRSVLGAGAHGLFEKSRSMDELLSAIRLVAAGNTFSDAEWASIIDSNYKLLNVKLSDQQKTVLELMAAGETDKMIAKKMGISPNTVILIESATALPKRAVLPRGESSWFGRGLKAASCGVPRIPNSSAARRIGPAPRAAAAMLTCGGSSPRRRWHWR